MSTSEDQIPDDAEDLDEDIEPSDIDDSPQEMTLSAESLTLQNFSRKSIIDLRWNRSRPRITISAMRLFGIQCGQNRLG
jgi:hypothetical protein